MAIKRSWGVPAYPPSNHELKRSWAKKQILDQSSFAWVAIVSVFLVHIYVLISTYGNLKIKNSTYRNWEILSMYEYFYVGKSQ